VILNNSSRLSFTVVEGKPRPRSVSQQHRAVNILLPQVLVNFASLHNLLGILKHSMGLPNSQKLEYKNFLPLRLLVVSFATSQSPGRQLRIYATSGLRVNSKELSGLSILLTNSHWISRTRSSRYSKTTPKLSFL